jgi:threonyl-tRNA synthetase
MSASATIDKKSEEYLNNLRHSTAHVMAQAVQDLTNSELKAQNSEIFLSSELIFLNPAF